MKILQNFANIPILSTGNGWMAVDKPAGLSVHNDPGADLCALVEKGFRSNPVLAEAVGGEPESGIHPVHRLDRQTSGVILLACDPEIFRRLSEQFEKRTVIKRYIAILHGRLPDPDTEDGWGLWDFPLSESAGGRNDPQGRGKRFKCRTRFRVTEHTPHYTLVECELLTGRKHQIRRHARLAGHAVTGDDRYGTVRSIRYLQERCGFFRLGLHAASLTFTPPEKACSETVTAAISPEMSALLDTDRNSENQSFFSSGGSSTS